MEGELSGEARRTLGLDGLKGLNAAVFALGRCLQGIF